MATVHDRNTDQAAYWNGPAGRRWMERQDTQDILLAPISELLFDRAHPGKGERVVDIGCGCGATTHRTRAAGGPDGLRAWGGHFCADARPGARACAGGPAFGVRACRCHGACLRAWAQRSSVLPLWRHVLRRPGAFVCQHAQGAADRRPPGVRLLARAAQKPMDDDSAAGSVQARSAPP